MWDIWQVIWHFSLCLDFLIQRVSLWIWILITIHWPPSKVSDIGRPCAKPLPYVISLNPGNSLEKRGKLYHLKCRFSSRVRGPGQCPLHLAFVFPTEHRPPNTCPPATSTFPGFYFIFFRTSSIIILHINQYVNVIIHLSWHSQIYPRLSVFYQPQTLKFLKENHFVGMHSSFYEECPPFFCPTIEFSYKHKHVYFSQEDKCITTEPWTWTTSP